MTRRECITCGKRPQSGVAICRACERRTVRHLADQEAHRLELEVALTRMVHMQAPNDGGRSAEVPLVYAEAAAEALHSQRSLLVSWVRMVTEDNPRLPMPADTVASMSAHLGHWMPILRMHEAIGELIDELTDLVNRILAVIDTPENRTRILVGPCPEAYEDPCPGQVEAIVPRDESIPGVMRCGACKSEWTATQWTRTGARILRRRAELERQRRLALEMSGRGAA